MAKRLTDKQKKKIIADYVQMQSYRAVARANNTTATTVRNIVQSDADTLQKCAQKKEENTADVLAHMDKLKKQACGVINNLLTELGNEEKIKRAPLIQVATAMAVVIDKFTAGESKNRDEEMRKVDEIMRKMDDDADH